MRRKIPRRSRRGSVQLSGTESSLTLRWREMDSNFWYRGAFRPVSINQTPKGALPRMFATKPGFVGIVWFEPPKILGRRCQARAVDQMRAAYRYRRGRLFF